MNVSSFFTLPIPRSSFFGKNWRSEFYKWLGRDRVGIATYSKDPIELHAFKNS